VTTTLSETVVLPSNVAVMVCGPVEVELNEPVVCPFASVGAEGWVILVALPLARRATVTPETGLPPASLAVTVMVEGSPAATVVGLASTVD
jgi:hypothetical protein